MTNDLTKMEIKPVEYKQGTVKFNQYEEILSQAKELASYIENVEVTDENVKETKKMLAAVNKKVKELEDNRINIKKEMLKPYQTFEEQVKEIVGVVKTADSLVRSQVRELEEMEREQKKQGIIDLFDKRKEHYPEVTEHLDHDDFVTEKHLNKSVTMNKIEQEMVDWFESRKRDLKVIKTQDDVIGLLEIYTETQDLSMTFDIHNQNQQKRKDLEQIINKDYQNNDRQTDQKRFILELHSEKDYKFAKMLLDQNGIEYSSKEVK